MQRPTVAEARQFAGSHGGLGVNKRRCSDMGALSDGIIDSLESGRMVAWSEWRGLRRA